jgi:LmbE family N-acetylglucosaminyl deacetylase
MNPKRVFILSPHTDDAELGAGGIISKFIEQKIDIFWTVFSSAEESLPANMPKDTLKREFNNVTKHLGLNENQFQVLDYKVRKLHESRQDILEYMVKVRNEFKPDLVIGPSLNDFHQDHQVVCMEMIRAFKTHCSILCYELPWNHLEFNSRFFIKLEKHHIDNKVEMLKYYQSQTLIKRSYFSEEFIRGHASSKGAQINEKYAEAFDVIRWIN